MGSKKSFEQKVEEHAHLRAVAHRVVDQMTTKELHQFFRRRQQFLEQESVPQEVAKETQQ